MPTESTDVYDLKRQIERLEKECEGLQQRLSDVERDRVEYLQNVSHQIVAPLNAIKWHIENLTETRVSIDRAKKVLRSIYSQATLAAHLAKNFRLMSNLETEHALSALKEPSLPTARQKPALTSEGGWCTRKGVGKTGRF